MGACPECQNGGRLCTYEEVATKCKPCQQLNIKCSGNFDSEEFDRLYKLEQQYERKSLDAMRRLETLFKEVDGLSANMSTSLTSLASINAIKQRLQALDSQITAEERIMENTDRMAKGLQRVRTKMFQRELRALDELADEEGQTSETEMMDTDVQQQARGQNAAQS